MPVRPDIWWIASYPKSGNTWVRAFLTAYLNKGELDINRLIGSQDIRTYYHHVVSHRPFEEQEIWEQFVLRPAALLHRFARTPGRMWVKTHNINGKMEDIPMVPTLLCKGAIYIIRDPRSVAVSFARHSSSSVGSAIEAMNRMDHGIRRDGESHLLGSWSRHVTSWVDQTEEKNIEIVHYEDMVLEPRKTFFRIARHCFDQVDETALDRAIEATRFEKMKEQEEKVGFREKHEKQERFFRRGSLDWTAELFEDEVQQIEEDHQEVMREVGYL